MAIWLNRILGLKSREEGAWHDLIKKLWAMDLRNDG
jgi:hypothetical protein